MMNRTDEEMIQEKIPVHTKKKASVPKTDTLLGASTDLHKADVPLVSDITRREFSVPLVDILEKAVSQRPSEEERVLPGLVGHDGLTAVRGKLKNDKTNRQGGVSYVMKATSHDEVGKNDKSSGGGGVADAAELAATLSPTDCNALLSEPNSASNKIDFNFLKELVTLSNLGEINEVRVSDSMKVGFELTVTNKITRYFTVEHLDSKPIQLFSAFYPSFKHGVLAREASGGTNVGWELIKSDLVKVAFQSVQEKLDEEEPMPLLLNTCDKERVYIDQSTAILLGWHDNLPYRRVTVSFNLNKMFGSITSITVSGIYEKKFYNTMIQGILTLLEDYKNFREILKVNIEELDREDDARTIDLREGLSEEDILKLYKDFGISEGREEWGSEEKEDWKIDEKEHSQKEPGVPRGEENHE